MICSIWAWLSNSNNAGAVQAIGSILQVIAAVLTLGAMFCLGYKQNKISKEQKEISRTLSLYEKKYKVYMELIKLLNKVAYEIKMPTSAINATDYMKAVGQAVCDFDFNTNERMFLFDKELLAYIDQLKSDIVNFSSLVNNKAENLKEHEFLDMDKDILDKKVEFEKLEVEIRRKFEKIFNFQNI